MKMPQINDMVRVKIDKRCIGKESVGKLIQRIRSTKGLKYILEFKKLGQVIPIHVTYKAEDTEFTGNCKKYWTVLLPVHVNKEFYIGDIVTTNLDELARVIGKKKTGGGPEYRIELDEGNNVNRYILGRKLTKYVPKKQFSPGQLVDIDGIFKFEGKMLPKKLGRVHSFTTEGTLVRRYSVTVDGKTYIRYSRNMRPASCLHKLEEVKPRGQFSFGPEGNLSKEQAEFNEDFELHEKRLIYYTGAGRKHKIIYLHRWLQSMADDPNTSDIICTASSYRKTDQDITILGNMIISNMARNHLYGGTIETLKYIYDLDKNTKLNIKDCIPREAGAGEPVLSFKVGDYVEDVVDNSSHGRITRLYTDVSGTKRAYMDDINNEILSFNLNELRHINPYATLCPDVDVKSPIKAIQYTEEVRAMMHIPKMKVVKKDAPHPLYDKSATLSGNKGTVPKEVKGMRNKVDIQPKEISKWEVGQTLYTKDCKFSGQVQIISQYDNTWMYALSKDLEVKSYMEDDLQDKEGHLLDGAFEVMDEVRTLKIQTSIMRITIGVGIGIILLMVVWWFRASLGLGVEETLNALPIK